MENIKKAFPSWSDLKVNLTLRRTYLFFAQNFIDFISVPSSWHGIIINVKGEKFLKEAMAQDKGVILISGHFGCWEILGKWVGEQVPLFTGVAQRQKNKGANKFFQQQREIPGTGHIFRKEPIEKMYDILNKKGILGLVSDQDAKQKGVFTDFFGHPASTPKGAALFHIRTSAPMLVGVCIKKAFMNYEIKFLKVDTSSQNIKNITQQYTSILEKCIRSNPEQYFWFHRRWKTKP
jgi:KDO2-lipid IV(A) lauroyltransferase|tara:strand:- start:1139 stop:1843 length:705 start_codon:yes stop_codon:yes gene_type:complete